MSIEAVLRLLIAVCRALEIRPEELAAAFLEDKQNQQYYELLLRLVQETA